MTLTSVLKIQTLLRNDDESEVENEEYYFEENDVKTEEYYGEMSFQQSLLERSYEALKLLIQNDAYDSMKKSTDLWIKKEFNRLVDEIISYIRTLLERIHTKNLKVTITIEQVIPFMLQCSKNFFAVDIDGLGD